MKKYSKECVGGFTLIELLVVVLIIGILSAVALPQYTKAVEKSRIAEAKVVLRNLVNASVRFGLENPDGDPVLSEFDITIPGTYGSYDGYTHAVVGDKWAYYIADTYTGGSQSYGASSMFCAQRIGKSYLVCAAGPGYDRATLAQGGFLCDGSEADCKAVGATKGSDNGYYF